ncbi:MAG: low molecular weight phosphatase family protein [Gulosibacter sp.]|uniref:arsenate reductase/protein-tyrosine-phosphatase family protein n=1 Tax=Gulosibacter sp. TaxID=2817531 RepID=UPI003F9085CF
MALRILTVCTGNICRSPIAQRLLQQQLPIAGLTVLSVGVRAIEGQPMTESGLEVARRVGVEEPESHRARQLRAQDVTAADLILTLDRTHRRRVAKLVPNASRRTFTVREFGALVTSMSILKVRSSVADQPYPATAALQLALLKRGMQPRPQHQEDYDVIDPYGRAFEVYEQAAGELVPAIEMITGYFTDAVDWR